MLSVKYGYREHSSPLAVRLEKCDSLQATAMAEASKARVVLREVGVVLSCFARFAGVSYCLLQAADTIKCVGPSMLPTLNRDGDIVLLDKLSPRFHPLEPGEVVIAKSVSNPRHTVCKRIIAQVCPHGGCRSHRGAVAYSRAFAAQEGDTVCVRPHYSSSQVEFHKV